MAKQDNKVQYVWASLRISLGLIFLWAFFDKLFGLGYATCRQETGEIIRGCSNAVIEGGSATTGFLKFGTSGPLSDFYQGLAGNSFIDGLFMAGLLGIGIALLLGIGMRIAVATGSLLMLMMWSASLPPENNPLIDDHIIYILVLAGLLLTNKNQVMGLGNWWSKTKLVKTYSWLE